MIRLKKAYQKEESVEMESGNGKSVRKKWFSEYLIELVSDDYEKLQHALNHAQIVEDFKNHKRQVAVDNFRNGAPSPDNSANSYV